MQSNRNNPNRKRFKLGDAILSAYETEVEDVLSFSDCFARLRSELDQFDERLQVASKANEFLDFQTARELFVLSAALFRVCQKEPFAEHVPFSLAAVSYFVRDDDANPDFESIDGFEDDKQVLQEIISVFQLESKINSEVASLKLKEPLRD